MDGGFQSAWRFSAAERSARLKPPAKTRRPFQESAVIPGSAILDLRSSATADAQSRREIRDSLSRLRRG
jgi:hypothetical protein